MLPSIPDTEKKPEDRKPLHSERRKVSCPEAFGTCPDPVLQASVIGITEAIAEKMHRNIHSVWLYGSLVLDDYRPGWSDIDLLVLTDGQITETQAEQLLMLRQALKEKEPENPYYRSFEGIIAPLEEYRTQSFTRLVYWGTSGQRILDCFRQDAFSAFGLAKYGRCVYGKEDRSIFPLPDRAALVTAVRETYESIRKYALQTDERLYSCGWLLDIARCIYTLRTGGIIAKTQAGIWALEQHLFPEEEALRKTVEIRQHPAAYKDREEVRQWLQGLGPTVQRCADVLEHELILAGSAKM